MPPSQPNSNLVERLNALYKVKPYLTPVFRLYTPDVALYIKNNGTLPAATCEELAASFSVAAAEQPVHSAPAVRRAGGSQNLGAQASRQSLESYRRVNIGTAGGDYYVERIWSDDQSSRTAKLNSPRRPAADAEKNLKNFEAPERLMVLVSGLGSGHHLPILIERTHPRSLILLLEYSVELCYLLLEPFLLAALERPGFHLLIPGLEESIFNYIDGLPVTRFQGIRPYRDSAGVRAHPAYYSALEGRIQKIFSIKMSDLLTRLEFEGRWIRNILRNTLSTLAAGPEKTVRNLSAADWAPRNEPAFLVSAGPSLRESLDYLRAWADHAFILCVDTAYPVLYRAGIRPDAVITLDAQSHSIFHFLATPLNDVPLFTDTVGYPPLVHSAQNLIFYSTAQFTMEADGQMRRESTAGMELLESAGIFPGDVQSGGSVATSGFDLLRNLGFDDVILIGQDLAYSGREIHSTGTHHNGKWRLLLNRTATLEDINEQIIQKRNLRYRPGLNGDTVLTDYVLELYAKWFEDTVQNVDTKIRNASTRGLQLDGIEKFNQGPTASPKQGHPIFASEDAKANWKASFTPRLNDLWRNLMAVAAQIKATQVSGDGQRQLGSNEVDSLLNAEDIVAKLCRKKQMTLKRKNAEGGEYINAMTEEINRQCRGMLFTILRSPDSDVAHQAQVG